MTLPDRFRAVLREYLDERRGRRADLARAIGCHKMQVSDWLKDRTPSHEFTLAVLAYLPAVARRKIFTKEKP